MTEGFVAKLRAELLSQHNRFTHAPMFFVQRIDLVPCHQDVDPTHYECVYREDGDHGSGPIKDYNDALQWARFETACDKGVPIEKVGELEADTNYEIWPCIAAYKVEAAFFSEKAAKLYCEASSHPRRPCRVRAASMYGWGELPLLRQAIADGRVVDNPDLPPAAA